jgi:TRAP-type mannitol/chloroaromatic compound transport system permease small subunit
MNTLYRITSWIDRLNGIIGKTVSWLAVTMVLSQFAVVVLRYVFGISFIKMQEGVMYQHAALFMLGAGYTLLHEGHVRVDIFYRTASPLAKAKVDLVGALIFMLPICGLILWASVPYVASSWAEWEGSVETSGIQAVYLLKSLILTFAVLMGLQGIAMAMRSVLTIKGLDAPHPKADEVEI